MNNTFGKNIIPENESARLEALKRYGILDTMPEPTFDRIASMTARVFNMPIALISFVDKEEVFFKANVGLNGVTHTDRGVSLCSLAVLSEEVTVFDNPLNEPCLLSNPLVTGKFGLRFYAAAPLRTRDGYNIGSICIVDKKLRYINEDQKRMLEDIAAIVMDQLEGRIALQVLKEMKDISQLVGGHE